MGRIRSGLLAAFVVGGATAHAQTGYVDRLWAAGPDAERLIALGHAPDWMAAPEIVRDRVGFIVFGKAFPRKALISQDDLTACVTRLARVSPKEAPIYAMIDWCKEKAEHAR